MGIAFLEFFFEGGDAAFVALGLFAFGFELAVGGRVGFALFGGDGREGRDDVEGDDGGSVAELAQGRGRHGSDPDLDVFDEGGVGGKEGVGGDGGDEGVEEGGEGVAEAAEGGFFGGEGVVCGLLELEGFLDLGKGGRGGVLVFNVVGGNVFVAAAALGVSVLGVLGDIKKELRI